MMLRKLLFSHNIHGTDPVASIRQIIPGRIISTFCAISISSNERKKKYVLMLPQINCGHNKPNPTMKMPTKSVVVNFNRTVRQAW